MALRIGNVQSMFRPPVMRGCASRQCASRVFGDHDFSLPPHLSPPHLKLSNTISFGVFREQVLRAFSRLPARSCVLANPALSYSVSSNTCPVPLSPSAVVCRAAAARSGGRAREDRRLDAEAQTQKLANIPAVHHHGKLPKLALGNARRTYKFYPLAR